MSNNSLIFFSVGAGTLICLLINNIIIVLPDHQTPTPQRLDHPPHILANQDKSALADILLHGPSEPCLGFLAQPVHLVDNNNFELLLRLVQLMSARNLLNHVLNNVFIVVFCFTGSHVQVELARNYVALDRRGLNFKLPHLGFQLVHSLPIDLVQEAHHSGFLARSVGS